MPFVLLMRETAFLISKTTNLLNKPSILLFYKNIKMISDALLKNYVDEVFMTYDRDRSGSLEPNELANFFNDVFEKMHNPSRYTI